MIGKMKVAVVVFGSLLFVGFAFGQRVIVYSPVFETVVPETVVVERPLLPVTPPPVVVQRPVTVLRPLVPVAPRGVANRPTVVYSPVIEEMTVPAPVVTYSPVVRTVVPTMPVGSPVTGSFSM